MVKTVLITGASRRFGKDAALLFESKSWNAAATMRTPEKAESWTRAAAPRPAYKALMIGFEKASSSIEPRLPGLENAAKMIYRAATDTSSRLRYPAIAFPMITIRKLFGARIWTALMSLWVSSMLKKKLA